MLNQHCWLLLFYFWNRLYVFNKFLFLKHFPVVRSIWLCSSFQVLNAMFGISVYALWPWFAFSSYSQAFNVFFCVWFRLFFVSLFFYHLRLHHRIFKKKKTWVYFLCYFLFPLDAVFRFFWFRCCSACISLTILPSNVSLISRTSHLFLLSP